jgi:hypothetical protein
LVLLVEFVDRHVEDVFDRLFEIAVSVFFGLHLMTPADVDAPAKARRWSESLHASFAEVLLQSAKRLTEFLFRWSVPTRGHPPHGRIRAQGEGEIKTGAHFV